MLKWLRARGYAWREMPDALNARSGCPRHDWAHGVCVHAAFGGHLAVLQWARAHGCPWDERTCTAAWLGGHLPRAAVDTRNRLPVQHLACVEETREGRELLRV